MKKNSKHGLIILLSLVVLLIVIILLNSIKKTSNKNYEYIQEMPSTSSDVFNFAIDKPKTNTSSFFPYIAVVYIEGTIQQKNKTYNHDFFIKTIKDLQKDKKNLGLIVFIDSPGGTVYHSDDIYLSLIEYKKTNRPLWAYLGSMAASGGYYAACACDEIYANRNCLTGSIGVIAGQSVDMTKLMEKIGVKMTTITAGKNKNMLNPDSPITAEQKDIMQSIADEAYDQFTQIVAKGRGLSIEQTKTLADGRIYTANQALKNGLIDYTDVFENVIHKMNIKVSSSKVQVRHFKPKEKTSFADFMIEKSNNNKTKSELEQLIQSINQITLPENLDYPAYYFYK